MNATWIGALIFVAIVGGIGIYLTRKSKHSEK